MRRRVAQLTAQGRLVTQVLVDPRRLGLPIEAKLLLHVAPTTWPPQDRPWPTTPPSTVRLRLPAPRTCTPPRTSPT